jgi:Fe-S-cluster containining protein
LIQKEKKILRGLTLLPDEINLFSEEHLKPYLGIGKRSNDPEFKIVAYQLNTGTCPNLKENMCAFYTNRPSTCRQFPFSLDLDPEAGILIGVDLNCPSASELVNNSNRKIEARDLESAMNLFELKKLVLNVLKNVWVFDLFSKKWLKYEID